MVVKPTVEEEEEEGGDGGEGGRIGREPEEPLERPGDWLREGWCMMRSCECNFPVFSVYPQSLSPVTS